MRRESTDTRRTRDARGVDVSAIEQMDRRCLQLLHEDGEDRKYQVRFSEGTAMALLVQIELPADIDAERAFEQIAAAGEAGAPDTPMTRFCRLLDRAGVLDDTEMALPGAPSSSSMPARPCPPPSSTGSPLPSRQSTRRSKRPPPT
jgi:D-lactate dehydrogenase (cytochrome)